MTEPRVTAASMTTPLYVIVHNTDDPRPQGYGCNLGVLPRDYSESIRVDAVQCVLTFQSETDAWRWLGVNGDDDDEHTRAMRAHWRVVSFHHGIAHAYAMARAVMDFETICNQRDALLHAAEALAAVANQNLVAVQTAVAATRLFEIAARVRKEVPT